MLRTASGIGPAQIAQLAAAFELARRWATESTAARPRMKGLLDIVAIYAPRLRDLTFEEFHIVALDTQHGIERSVCVSRGCLSSTSVEARNVLRAAIEAVAAGIVLVHNHPSGDPTPSPEDRQLTMQLAVTGRTINIPVYDHIIIGREGFVSFLEQQWL